MYGIATGTESHQMVNAWMYSYGIRVYICRN